MSAVRSKVITDAVNPSIQTAKIAATAAGSAGISFTPPPEGKLLIVNSGPNMAYVQISANSATVAAVPGAAFAPGAIPVAVGDTQPIDVSRMKPDANGFLWISAICDATFTAALALGVYN